jgi:hypothetical protein
MRKVRAVVVACTLLLSMGLVKGALAQAPAKVAGKWQMSMAGRRGTMTQTLNIKQEGGKITGTLTGMGNRSFNLEGTVEGEKISFKVTRETGRGTFTTTYNGAVSGDTMKGTAEMGMGRFAMNWTAKRQQ